MTGVDVRVSDDPGAAAAELLIAALAAGKQVALAGGSTPRRAYERIAQTDADLSAATLWLGDERMVPADDERSSERLVRETLCDPLPIARRPRLEAVATAVDPDAAAADYEQRLRRACSADDPRLDVILLGLGPDAHTASLFPGKPAVDESERLVVAVPEAGMEPYVARVTFTLPLLNRARVIVFLVAGADKGEAVRRAFGTPPDPSSPAAHVRPVAGELTLLIDPAAAEGLR